MAHALRAPSLASPRRALFAIPKRPRSVSPRRHAAMASSASPPPRLSADRAVLFVCDVQDAFAPAIAGFDNIVHCASVMMRAAPALGDKKDGIPVFVTAQYPEKLGNTVEALKPYIKPRTATVGSSPDSHVVGKKRFSMVVPEIQKRYGKYPDRKQALLVGLEAHVCVLQTALDLLADGFEVFVLTDGVSSRDFADRSAAFRRMEAAGCVLATSEMALFEMLGGADSKGFKAVSALVKEAKPQPPMPSV